MKSLARSADGATLLLELQYAGNRCELATVDYQCSITMARTGEASTPIMLSGNAISVTRLLLI